MTRVLARGTPWLVPALWLAPLVVRRPLPRLGLLGAAAGVSWFFRDPDRVPEGEGMLAAADGVVRAVGREPDGRWVVSTYLDLRDVHVTRAPCDAYVRAQHRRSGRHHRASTPASDHNHRLEWELGTDSGPAQLTQYAGLLARRIVAYPSAGDRVARGERIGLIRFGSRVDLTLPTGWRPTVEVGVRLRGGATVVGRAS